jgi:hypothetical protein
MRFRHRERLNFTLVEFILQAETLAPLPDVAGVQGEAKQIGWDEP